ncbi:MAG TPA: hypothetical protein VFQ91_05280 [Bryobacteraceae bacterium]|nr:hypothetical protein [Bryobacteraceae bacterium]
MLQKYYKLVFFSLTLSVSLAVAQPLDDDNASSSSAVEKRTLDPVKPSKTQTGENAVDWNAVYRQSAMFTGIQHAFRLGTEPGTRNGMRGPFWRGYADSVGNLHGWGDGDPFLVNYIGHPIQGSVSGFIYIQNDPQARLARFGRDPRYWRSRMKAMGVAWAYSTWFEIGPFSEASIGKIQSRRPQQGFVDHVVTPIIGTGWLVAEDFLDEKVVLAFERRFENRFARMMVRSWLNPSRSFSNALRFKVPWYRDSRGGILEGHYRAPYVMEPEAPREFPKAAPFEITAIPMWAKYEGTQCAGGGGQAAFRLSTHWQLVGQLGGCQLRDLNTNNSGDSLTYVIGPRWTPMSERRVSPFAQVLVGGNKLTRYEVDPVRERLLKAEAKLKGLEMPAPELYTKSDIRHGMALQAGTGVDIRVNPAVALRLASIEYARSWAGTPAGAMDGRNWNQGLLLSSGVILRMGTW